MAPFDPEAVPLRVVCATRAPAEGFGTETLTGRSLTAAAGPSPCELRLFAGNTDGLASVYNRAIDEAADDPALLVFVHDDVLVTDLFWADRVRAGLGRFDVVSVAGTRRRADGQPGWIMVDLDGRLEAPEHLSGAIGQGDTFPPERVDVFGPTGQACLLLDGVFLAADSRTLHRTGLRFDERFAFDFYDLDLCRSAEALGLTMGTIALSLVHASLGTLDGDWHEAYRRYLAKWEAEELPDVGAFE